MAILNSGVSAKTLTADGSIYASRARVKGIHVTTTSAGSVALKDGGASGTTLLDVAIGANYSGNIIIPMDGILFETSVYLDLTNATSVTVFYQG
jgi:hypothetical protein